MNRMNIVITGHVDHGKSTLIGRLLADTESLPEGKLDSVRNMCAKNARPFEYAFLLDALEDEQKQGITIDSARVFFKSEQREYIIIDAPGHIEFLKNMLTGASRAKAAVLLIDAAEGIAENSRRHGLLLSLLGIRQVVVAVNKMDLVGYDKTVFDTIVEEYGEYLAGLGITPKHFIPVAARNGDNLKNRSEEMGWYTGATVLEALDGFEEEKDLDEKPFAMPVQDIYKFTADNDNRRIFAGTVVSGSLKVGDQVTFLPSGKSSRVRSIESFNTPVKMTASAGEAAGFTLETQIYVKPGEVAVVDGVSSVKTSSQFRANVFWLANRPFEAGRQYKLKLAASKAPVVIESIEKLIDARSLDSSQEKNSIERHEAATVVLRTSDLIAFDTFENNEPLGRFVIIDEYNIAGGGIILNEENSSAAVIRTHTQQEIELNAYIRKHYPHWECVEITS